MSLTASLMRTTYPAVLIERWTRTDGWPCYRIFLALPCHLIGTLDEYETYDQAHVAALDMAAAQAPADCPVIDMTERGA